MAIDYSFQIEGDLLICMTQGYDDSYEKAAQYAQAVVAACLENGCTRILCDERKLEYRLGTIDTYKLAQALTTYAPDIRKAALVCSIENIIEATFWETVAVNRGATVQVFQSVEDARSWLDE